MIISQFDIENGTKYTIDSDDVIINFQYVARI